MTNAKILKKEIEEIIKYIDETIEAKNATEPNAYTVRNLLQKALEKAK